MMFLPDSQTRLQISGPSDFSHISHLGPGAGPFTSNLIDRESDRIPGDCK
jgi:hypothetical protein